MVNNELKGRNNNGEKGYKFGQPLVPQIETEQTIDEYLNAVDVEWKEFLKLL
jgi:hypothetical protein